MIELQTLPKLTETQRHAAAMLQLYMQERRPHLSGGIAVSSLTQPKDYYTQGEGQKDFAEIVSAIEAEGGRREDFLLLDGLYTNDLAKPLEKLGIQVIKIKSSVEPSHRVAAVNIAAPDFKKTLGLAIGALMADKSAQSLQALHRSMERMGGRFAFDSEFQVTVYEGALMEMQRLLESAKAKASGVAVTLTAAPAGQISRISMPS